MNFFCAYYFKIGLEMLLFGYQYQVSLKFKEDEWK